MFNYLSPKIEGFLRSVFLRGVSRFLKILMKINFDEIFYILKIFYNKISKYLLVLLFFCLKFWKLYKVKPYCKPTQVS